MATEFEALPGPLGAEVHGLGPGRLTESDCERLREAFVEYGVLVARRLALSPEEHIELTRVFGVPAIHPIPTIRLQGKPEIIVLAVDLTASLEPDDRSGDEVIGQIPWHSDLTYTDSPSRGALLLARRVPPELGQTGFIDAASVYDELPGTMQSRIRRLRAIHSLGPIQEQLSHAARANAETEGGDAPVFEQVSHPLVRVHPESQRKVLDISPAFVQAIEGLEPEESRRLLDELKAFATQERFAYQHSWEAGDLVVWDNWRMLHMALGHRKKHARCMHRTTLAPRVMSASSAA